MSQEKTKERLFIDLPFEEAMERFINVKSNEIPKRSKILTTPMVKPVSKKR